MTKFLENDRIWRGLAIFLLVTLVGIGGWGLLEVVAMPKTYITIEMSDKRKAEMTQQICNLKEEMNKNIDSIKLDMGRDIDSLKIDVQNNQNILRDRMILYQNKLENKMDHISDLLIEHMAEKNKVKK